jgi:hypothetical protein
MQQAAFKVCRVACREVCPPGEIGVYARSDSKIRCTTRPVWTEVNGLWDQ